MSQRIEHLRVKSNLYLAQRLGLPATLTYAEWSQTLSDFNGMCAYCNIRKFYVLEHFIPVEIAGTHVQNCIPACRECNIKKGAKRGGELVNMFGKEIIDRIQEYLDNRLSQQETLPRSFPEPADINPKPIRLDLYPSNTLEERVEKLLQVINIDLEQKSVYTVQELFEHVPVSLHMLEKITGVSQQTLKTIKSGAPSRGYLVNQLLAAFSEIYQRRLDIRNVQGLAIIKKKTSFHEISEISQNTL